MDAASSLERPPITVNVALAQHSRALVAIVAPWVLLAAQVAGVGCDTLPGGDRRMRMRTDGLRETVGIWSKVEQERPARLRRAAEFIAADLNRQAVAFERNAREAERLAERDVQRFQDRQPLYRDTAGRILWGKPQQIPPEIPILFY